MNKILTAALGAVAFVLIGGGFLIVQPPNVIAPQTLNAQAIQVQAEGETPVIEDMILGDESAPVTVVEYASFTCPHCRTFHENVFGDLKANYIDTGKVKFVYREVYFDKFGLWAGMVARCAGPDRYFGVVDLLYENQTEWLSSRNDAQIAADLRKIGLTSGIEPEALDACLADGAQAQAMVAAFQVNAEADSVRATPTFFIDGESYTNMNYTDFSAVLDARLEN